MKLLHYGVMMTSGTFLVLFNVEGEWLWLVVGGHWELTIKRWSIDVRLVGQSGTSFLAEVGLADGTCNAGPVGGSIGYRVSCRQIGPVYMRRYVK